MKSFQDIWLEKIAGEEEVSKKDVIYTLKKHEERERPEDEEKETPKEMEVEEKLDIEKHALQASDVMNNPKPVLLVSYSPTDEMSKQFVQRLDRALSGTSGIDRLQIKAVNIMKDRNTADQLKASQGISLFKSGKLIGSLGLKSSEQEIKKFIELHKRDII